MDKADLKVLGEIFDILDNELGDTDPIHWDEDMTDEDIKTEHPLFWACKQVGKLQDKYTKKPAKKTLK